MWNHINLLCQYSTQSSNVDISMECQTFHLFFRQEIAAGNDIGKHPTPPIRQLVVNKVQYKEGFDSNGEVGPCLDTVRGEGVCIYHEDTIGDQEGLTEAAVRTVPEVPKNLK